MIEAIKILSLLVLPSVVVFLLLLLGLVFVFLLRRRNLGVYLLIAGTLAYYLFSITPVADALLSPLENEYAFLSQEEMQDADVIVLLLGGLESNVLRASEVLRIAHSTSHRARVIISGTDPVQPNSEEAEGVRRFFVSRGIPAENIAIEGKSRTTKENVRHVVEMVEGEPFFLVTSAYHMHRSTEEFKREGGNPIPAPTDFKRRGGVYSFFDYVPGAHNLRNANLAMHEHAGRMAYAVSRFWEKDKSNNNKE